MPIVKKDLFSPQQNRLADLAKVLGHPARIAILEILSRNGACVCGSLVDELGLSQSTVSQHLKAMKLVGLIRGNVEGTAVCYCLDIKVCQEAMQSLGQLFKRTGCC